MADEINQNPVSPEVSADVFVAPTAEATQIETAVEEQSVAPVQVGAIVSPEASITAEVAQTEPTVQEVSIITEVASLEPVLVPTEPATETPVAITESVPDETLTPEKTTQPTPSESVIEAVPAQTESPVPSSEPVVPVESQEPSSVAESVHVPVVQNEPAVQVAEVPVLEEVSVAAVAVLEAQSGQSVRIDPIEPEILPETKAVLRATDPAQPTAQPPESLNIQKSVNKFLAKGNPSIEVRKQKKLERIIGMFNERANITNDEVEKFLHVSDSTATRYLATLEKEGKIKQGDKKGSAVSYSKI